MTVREKGINFLVPCLDDEESAHENGDGHNEKTSIEETSYAKRKKREEESDRQHKLSDKKHQVELFRELMSTPDNSSRFSSELFSSEELSIHKREESQCLVKSYRQHNRIRNVFSGGAK